MSTQDPDPTDHPSVSGPSFPFKQAVPSHQTQHGGRLEARDIYARNVVAGNQYNIYPAAGTSSPSMDALPFIAAEFPPLPALDARPNNLPIQLTPLIGREREIRACCTQLERNEGRLLTLTGPGGIGKTRLGLQVATELLDAFPHGIFFVDLAPLNDPHLVVSSIAQVLGIRETVGQPLLESLKEYLQGRTLLLVLDNFEHLMVAAPIVTDLRTAALWLKVLVTSRASLHLSGEQEFAVPPLELPNPEQLPALEVLVRGEAVALFVARTQEKKPGFMVSAANATDVAEICVRLEGLPLTIELAAARIKDMTPRELLQRLTSRLSLLTRGARDLPARQQTLRATLDWSHALLHVSEQTLFRRLAVFAGGWTLEAAEEVCVGEEIKPESVQDLLAQLVDNSLVVVEEQGEATRYRQLETIREYGAEKLQDSGEAASVHERHGEWYLERAEEAEPKLQGLEQVTWLKWLEIEHDNLRVVLRWAEESGEAEIALRLAGALWRFWERHSHLGEGRRWLETLLANRSTVVVAVQAKALRGAGALTIRQGNYEHAIKLFEESLRLYRESGDKSGIAGVLTNIGAVALDQGNYEHAIALFEESQALRRELEDKVGIVEVLTNMGFATMAQGDYGRATSLYKESLDLAQELGDKHSIAMALSSLGEVARYQGDYEHAISLYEKGLALRRELGDKDSIAFSLTNLGEAALDQGDYEHAISLFKEGLALAQELGDKELITYCLEEFAAVAGAQRQPVRAARLWGAAELLRAAMGIPLAPANQHRYERYIAVARALLDTTAFETAWREGQAMPLEQAITYALG